MEMHDSPMSWLQGCRDLANIYLPDTSGSATNCPSEGGKTDIFKYIIHISKDA